MLEEKLSIKMSENMAEKPPKDKYNLVFWIVFLIGFTILLPWNILITVR